MPFPVVCSSGGSAALARWITDPGERVRAGTGVAGVLAAATTDNTVIMALTSQITQLKKQHRQEVQALRTALEQAHGENPILRRELTRRGWTGKPPS